MNVSVIICTWNNSARLEKTLEAFSQLLIPKSLEWEVIVVNNNCTDNTDAVVDFLSKKLPILYLYEPQQGLSRARNAGLLAANGELIVFGDDDITPTCNWLLTYWRAYQQHSSGYYFGGPVESEFECIQPDENLLSLAPPSVKGLNWGMKECVLDERGWFLSANWACPRVVLHETGGFDEALGLRTRKGGMSVGEETDLQQRLQKLGWKPYYLPEASIQHYVPASKCTLEHICKRLQAKIYIEECKSSYKLCVKTIFGVPRWLLRIIAEQWALYIWKRVLGRCWYSEYINYRGNCTRIRIYLEKKYIQKKMA